MILTDFLVFSATAGVLTLLTHRFIPRHWLAMFVSATLSSCLNMAHEMIAHNFHVRPSDAVFWLPMLFFMGVVAALPAVAMASLSFYVIRRRIRLTAA